MKQKLVDELMKLFEDRIRDPRVCDIIYEGVILPLQTKISDGDLDAPIAAALARISTPVIVAIIVLAIMIIATLNIVIILLFRVNRLVIS